MKNHLLPFAELADAFEAAEEARAHLERLTFGSLQADVEQTLAWFDRTISGIADLQQALTTIQQAIADIANRLEGDGAAAASSVVSPPPATSRRSTSAVNQMATAAELLAKLPQRSESNRKTTGIWLDEAGREHEPITSGRDEGHKAVVDMLRRLGIGPARGELWAASHVEVKLAVQVRSTNAAHVTLVVNNEPCNQGRFSCDRILPRVLKAGQQVTVCWPGGVKTYRGGDT